MDLRNSRSVRFVAEGASEVYRKLIDNFIDDELTIQQPDKMYQLLLNDYKIAEPELFIQVALEKLDINYKLLASVIDFYTFTNKFLIDLAIDNLTNDELVKMIFYKMHHTFKSTLYLKFKYKLRDFITQRDSLLNDQFDSSSEEECEEFDLDGYMRSSMNRKIFEPQSSTSEEYLEAEIPKSTDGTPEVIIDGVSRCITGPGAEMMTDNDKYIINGHRVAWTTEPLSDTLIDKAAKKQIEPMSGQSEPAKHFGEDAAIEKINNLNQHKKIDISNRAAKQQLKIMKKYYNIEIDNTLSHVEPEMVVNIYELDRDAEQQLKIENINKAASDRAAKQQLKIMKKHYNIEIDNTLSHVEPEMVVNIYELDSAADQQLRIDESLRQYSSDSVNKWIENVLVDEKQNEKKFDKVRDELIKKFALESSDSSI